MKRTLSIMFAAAFAAFAVACAGGAAPAAAPAKDSAPAAAFDLPAPGSVLAFGPVQVVVHAEHAAGVAGIEISSGGVAVATWENPNPQSFVVYVFVWQPTAGGEHALDVRARSVNGAWGAKSSLKITVQEPASTDTPAPTLEPTPEPKVEELPPTPEPPTATPEPTILAITPTATFTPQPYVAPAIELYPSLSAHRFYDYYSEEKCYPRDAGVTVTASDPSQVYSVIIFFRVIDPFTYKIGYPTSGFALGPTKYGAFFMALTSRHIADPMKHVPSKVWYQFVGTDRAGTVIARTPYYTDMEILNCADPR